MTGQTVSHYKITEKLGGGGMGVVYKAEDTRLKRTVALKFLSPAFTFDHEAKKRFINEAQTASSIQHNNICNIHDIDETKDGQIFICMDFYEGKTLKEKIDSGKLQTEDAIDIIIQVAAGLNEAHGKGIVHRDIKPANIFITKDGTVKILDFGLAKLSGQTKMTKMGETVGTIAYMSPEQARGEESDKRTDIWSLGVMFFEMLSGKLPFQSDYEQAMIYAILNEPPKKLSTTRGDLNSDLEKIIAKCLSKNPSDRYSSVGEFLTELHESGLKKEESKTRNFLFAKKNKLNRVFYFISGFIIIAALSFSLWKYFLPGQASSERSKFIAVLPFHPITSSEEDKSFAEGMHDDILTQLSKINGLKVIARTSVMQYQNTQKTIKEIANELGVGIILEGTTRRSGDKIRITTQLIDAKTERHLWADSYDRQYSDIFAIQTDVAEKVANELKAVLTGDEKKLIKQIPTQSMEAYDYYVKGEQYWQNSNDIEGNKLAAQMFEKAVELDTTFALAYAKLSSVHSVLYTQGTFNQGEIHRVKAKSALNKAELLNSELPEVHYAKTNFYLFATVPADYDRALAECKLALKKAPNNTDYIFMLGNIMLDRGKIDKALEYFLESFNLNPNGFQEGHYISYLYILKRQWDTAEKWIDDYIPKHPENSIGYVRKAEISILGHGDLNKARTIMEEGLYQGRWIGQLIPTLWMIEIYSRNFNSALEKNELAPSFHSYKARKLYTLDLLGKKQAAKLLYDSARIEAENNLLKEPNSARPHNALAFIYAGLGMKEKAISEALKAVELPSWDLDNYFLLQLPSESNYRLIYVYIKFGEYQKALDKIEELLSRPYRFTKWNLKLDPLYDPLRNMPRFRKLVADY